MARTRSVNRLIALGSSCNGTRSSSLPQSILITHTICPISPKSDIHVSMESSATTLSPNATGTSPAVIGCMRNYIPSVSTTGLNGTVCAVSVSPSFLNISSCCTSDVRVVDNCTQYCEASNETFYNCVNDNPHTGLWIPTSCDFVGGRNNDTSPTTNTGMLQSLFGPSMRKKLTLTQFAAAGFRSAIGTTSAVILGLVLGALHL